MNTKRSIEELEKILKELNSLKKKAETIFQQLDNKVEKLSDEVLDTDYGSTLEDARDDLEDALWNGFDVATDRVSDTIFSLSLLNCSDKTPLDVDLFLNQSGYEGASGGFDMNAAISSAFLGHHLAQHHSNSSNNESGNFRRDDYNPFDTHGESSFDWVDENGDGYDDRDDGFWTEKEF